MKKLSVSIFAAIVLLLSGCASVPMATLDQDLKAKGFSPAHNKASLYIYRNENFGGAIPMTVSVNGKSLGQTAAKTYFKLNLEPGRYNIESHAENMSSLPITTEAGNNYFVWQEVKMGVWMARSLLQITDEATGRSGVMESKLIASTVSEKDLIPLDSNPASFNVKSVSSNDAISLRLRDNPEIRARQERIEKLQEQLRITQQNDELVRKKFELDEQERALNAQLERELRQAPATVDDLQPRLARLASTPDNPHLYALVIGINDYADVPDVPFANHSAKLFAEIARKKWGVLPENLILLTDADATSGRLRGRIKTLLNRLGPKDRLLVYFAGHGVPSQDGKSAYLLAQDGGPGSYEEPDLQLEVFYRQIEESRVGQASVFIDACFSGRSGKDSIVFEGVGGITLVSRTAVKPNGKLTVITAGRKDQFSNQDKAHGHRLFGYHLMKSMLEGPGNLNMTTLHEQIRDRVLADSRKIGPEFEQEPEMMGNAKTVVGR